MSAATDLCGVILAGGLSRRMGADKASTLLAGRSMLEHIAKRLAPQVGQLAVNANSDQRNGDPSDEHSVTIPGIATPLPVIIDRLSGRPGPLAGIAGAMDFAQRASTHSHVLIVPIDTPFLPTDLAQKLLTELPDRDSLVLARSLGRLHPVIGLWPVGLAEIIEDWLVKPDNRKLMVFLEDKPVVAVDFAPVETRVGPLDPFFNVNTPDDLHQAETHLELERDDNR
ncbi:molybdenum cofactor guanylyltransferase [Allorhizobium taibaishanense]|uniref:Molybdenum cofactor guanylyltransferase n=1 Tax=Allorhizobium taibaishanense TaxID=887144 RepID=A0A1Q9A1N3_9HYPH|nr:molybdenum cofactor guanylyltransferase [Allorhizobium taibaishanense]